MRTVSRSGSEEITACGSMTSPPTCSAVTRRPSSSILVTGVSRRTSPPISSMRAVIFSHI